MRHALTVTAFLAMGLLARAQDPSLEQVLTFETDHPGGAPTRWRSSPGSAARADAAVVRSGRWSARFERTAESTGDSGTLTTTVPLDVAGRALVVRAHLRTRDVTGFTAVFVRQEGIAPRLPSASSQNLQVRGSRDWHEHSVTLPIRPEGRQLTVGVVLGGTGIVWVDDVEITVDGVPYSAAPKVDRPKTKLDTDREFATGSRVSLDRLSPAQIDNLTTLGQVWGFLKYHHPAVRAGDRHWDFDLFRILPAILAAPDRHAASVLLLKWIADLGPTPSCSPCATMPAETLHLAPDLSFIDDARLGGDLARVVRSIHTNRPAAPSQFYVSLVPGIGNPLFLNEPAYPDLTVPDAGYQLLAVYRFWNIVQYWFPYRDVIGENWQGVLREFIPRVGLARDVQTYHRELMALIARVHDTHANLWSGLPARPPAGACALPITARFIGDQAVVTGAGAGLQPGDIITAIDGVPVQTLVETWRPYYAASNEPTRLRDMAESIGRGPCGSTTVAVLRSSGPASVTATRAPAAPRMGAPTHDLPGPAFRKLSPDVAYLKLSNVTAADAAKYVESAAGTRGLVIDIRNYPSAFVVFALGQLLVGEPAEFATFTSGDLITPGAFRWGARVSLRPAAPRYTGRVVILVDEVSQSQSEYTAMAFRVAPGAKVIGSTTAGADGNISDVPLPGGQFSMISGIGVFYPDKRPTQRVGIVPDVEVRPTIAGIRAGRDEVLEAAIREIVGPAVPAAEIQNMIAAARNSTPREARLVLDEFLRAR